MKKTNQNLADCSLCGHCQPVCPVFAATGRESDGPRGKMAILKALAGGRIQPRQALEPLGRCLLCGRCAAACPAGVKVDLLIARARQKLLPALGNLPARFARSLFLLHPGLLDKLQGPLALAANWRSKAPAVIARPLERLPALAPEPFRHESKAGGNRVLYFPGCISARSLPHIAQAGAKALEQAGYEVIHSPDFPCCGRPLLVNADKKGAARAMARNLALFARLEFDLITSPCPGCIAAMRNIWPNLDESGQAKDYLPRLRNIGELVACPAHGEGIYWHKPCSLAAPGDSPLCCGLPLRGQDSELARLLARELRDAVMAARARVMATACPGCVLAMRKTFAAHGDQVRVRHFLEIAAK